MYMNSPVLAGGRLYGLTHRQNGRLFALDPRSGKTLWQGDPRFAENASIVHAGGLLLVLTTEGELHVFAPREDGSLDRLRKHKVAESPVWAHLAVAGGRLLVKDRTAVRVFSIEG
jgi:outer membrane protein assembly factor BamB